MGFRGGQVKTNITGLAKALTASLKDYTNEKGQEIISATEKVASETVKKLKSTSPQRKKGGEYAASWEKQRVKFKYLQAVRYKVYNEQYRLPHLLEKSHVTRNGGRSKAQPHIKPAEEWAKNELQKRIEEVLKK